MMTGTLLLRLAAPLQSWGAQAKFDRRTTERTPTKSGVIGLVASAMGIRRNESIEALRALRFGVRLDCSGTLLRDYHTAKSLHSAYVTNRYYLEDAVFLVGLEGEQALLEEIASALQRPAYPLFLGRRSCPPAGRVVLGIREGVALEAALEAEPLLKPPAKHAQPQPRIRVMVESRDLQESAYFLRDNPISYDQFHRQFGFRRIREYSVPCIMEKAQSEVLETVTLHDPMAELED